MTEVKWWRGEREGTEPAGERTDFPERSQRETRLRLEAANRLERVGLQSNDSIGSWKR